jgi:hypothetical protein
VLKRKINNSKILLTWFVRGCGETDRGMAKDPDKTDEYFASIADLYKVLYERGELKTKEPLAEQIYAYDEWGVNPQGRTQRVLSFKQSARRFNLKSGERAEFLVTFGLTVRADSVCCIPPVIVHQGAELSAYHADGLPRSWLVGVSPSGYITKELFEEFLDLFLANCGGMRPLFLWFDGFWAHVTGKIRFMRVKGVYCCFTQSKDSENGQAGDCGAIGHIRSISDKNIIIVMAPLPGEKITPPLANTALVRTWDGFIRTCAPATDKAFNWCGIHPFNRLAKNQVEKHRLAVVFMNPEAGARHREVQIARGEFLGEVRQETVEVPKKQLTTCTYDGPGGQSQLTLLTSAWNLLGTRTVAGAHELACMRQKNTTNKKRTLAAAHAMDPNYLDARPPNTSAGAMPTGDFLDAIDRMETNQRIKAQRLKDSAAAKTQQQQQQAGMAEHFILFKRALEGKETAVQREQILLSLQLDVVKGIVSHLTQGKASGTKKELLVKLRSVLPSDVASLFEGAAAELQAIEQVRFNCLICRKQTLKPFWNIL